MARINSSHSNRYNKYYILIFVFIVLLTFNGYSQANTDSLFNKLFRTVCGGWIAGDATFSVDLPDSNTLWLFGDSFIGTANPDSSITPGAKMIRNCAILQKGDSLISLYNGTFENPSAFVFATDSTWFWSEHGLFVNDTLRIFMSEFKTTDGAAGWNFEYVGLSMVNFSYPGFKLLNIRSIPYFDINHVMYGNCLLREGDYIYIYGRREEGLPQYHIPYPHIARVGVENINKYWQFFDGSTWVDNPALTRRIDDNPVSQEYCVFKHEGKYVLLSQEIWLSPKIYTQTSQSPKGPWENRTLVYKTPLPFDNMFTYNAYAHPQFDKNDKLLVSYNSNGPFQDIFKNVELYRPRFIRIPYLMMDTSFSTLGVLYKNEKAPQNIVLYQNFPNPATERTHIRFELKKAMYISLTLYNMQGLEIQTIVNKRLTPGSYQVTLNFGGLKAGYYYYRIGNQLRLLLLN